MRLGFEKLCEEQGIEYDDLPKNLQVAINECLETKSRILAKTNIGQNVSETTIERIRVKDQMIVRQIIDLLEDDDSDVYDEDDDSDDDGSNDLKGSSKNNNSDDDSDDDDTDDDSDDNDSDDNSDDNSGKSNEMNIDSATLIAIDQELNALHKSGSSEFSLADLRSKARNTYAVLWDSYEANEENGIETSNFSLIETAINSEAFKLTKL